MKIRSEILKNEGALLLVSTVLLAAVPISAASAADQAVPAVQGPGAGVANWYFYGGFEAGNRFVFDRPPPGYGRAPPPANWLTPLTTQSRAKFEEYGQVRRGAVPRLDQSADGHHRRQAMRSISGDAMSDQ